MGEHQNYQEIKEMLMNQYIEKASEQELRYLDKYFMARVNTYLKLRGKIKDKLRGIVDEVINGGGYGG
jgi:hypothetical protein